MTLYHVASMSPEWTIALCDHGVSFKAGKVHNHTASVDEALRL